MAIGNQNEVVIEAGRTGRQYWRDLWDYRELFYFLAWRDLIVRYKQTVIGIAWSLIRPILTMVVFTVIFGKLGKFPSHGVPYPVLVFAAMLPWQFFANALTLSSNSLVADASLISKVYFPRIIVPATSLVVSLVDFLISLTILFALMAWYHYVPTWKMLLLPFFLSLALCTSLGAGLWLAALNVKYRDFRYIVPFVVQLGLYVSPVGFSSAVVPDRWRLLYSVNPMVGVIDGFRSAILGGSVEIYWPGFALSVVLSAALLLTGLWYFRRTERVFADVI